MKQQEIQDLVRSVFDAYVKKDRALIESALAEDFHFTSPLDNRLDRAAYFEICWPNSKQIDHFEILDLVVSGEKAFVTYVGRVGGKRIRSTETFTVRDGRVAEVEVYFGWDVPHPVPEGEHRDP